MKPIILFLALASAAIAATPTPITKEEHDTLKTFNVQDLNLNASELAGKIIAIRFTHRHNISRDDKTGLYSVRIGYHMPGTDYAHIQILYPEEGAVFFNSVSQFKSMPQWYVVYGRVEKDEHGRQLVRAVGRNIKMTVACGGEITW
jgi:hypothetical protein